MFRCATVELIVYLNQALAETLDLQCLFNDTIPDSNYAVSPEKEYMEFKGDNRWCVIKSVQNSWAFSVVGSSVLSESAIEAPDRRLALLEDYTVNAALQVADSLLVSYKMSETMEVIHRCRTFSIIANLTELESFILHDSTAQSLYQQFLALEYPTSRKCNHIPFFVDMVNVGNKGNLPTDAHGAEYLRAELFLLYEKYFSEQSEFLLDIPRERLQQVRRNVERNVTMVAFKPAIKAVVKDLAFIHMDSFINSPMFKDLKDTYSADYNLAEISEGTVKEKESGLKLRRFFGEKFVRAGKGSLRGQPTHIKEYKLSKIFGERVGVEKTALLERAQGETSEDSAQTNRRNRRLHVFFGDNFQVEETLFSERVRSRSVGSLNELRDVSELQARKQPTHVKSFRLARFFGARPPICEPETTKKEGSEGSEGDIAVAGHSKSQHLMRFFGERMDPVKEASHASFASQPQNVKGCTLKKIFGESAAHTIHFDGGTWPKTNRTMRSREKLEKIFGPFEG